MQFAIHLTFRMNQVSDSEGSGRFAKRFFSKVHRNRNLKGSICSATGGDNHGRVGRGRD